MMYQACHVIILWLIVTCLGHGRQRTDHGHRKSDTDYKNSTYLRKCMLILTKLTTLPLQKHERFIYNILTSDKKFQ